MFPPPMHIDLPEGMKYFSQIFLSRDVEAVSVGRRDADGY